MGDGAHLFALSGWTSSGQHLSCAIFAAVTGVSVATAATVATVAVPELTKKGYDREMVFGSLAGGGTLGILMPECPIYHLWGHDQE